MSKVRVKVSADASAIKSQLRRDKKFSQGMRLHAVYQIASGKNIEDVQKLYSASHKSICSWVHRYNAEGVDGLKNRPHSGRHSRLSVEQKAMLQKAISRSPAEEGFPSEVWSWRLIVEYIQKRFSVEYKKAQIYNILRSLGFSCQQGKGFFRKPEAKSLRRQR
ncbi:MAG: helix-turn-helix domain-containing protein [Prevotellaceae bacterium]|jgi:transposase|nr:helix-turn-helix domain-containing protein [Prevotellaceae bacterium]